MSADDLPVEVWTLILGNIDSVVDRLRLGLACRKLRAATVAATDTLDLTFDVGKDGITADRDEERWASLMQYLQRHGDFLRSLKVSRCLRSPWLLLPCDNLVELDARGDEEWQCEVLLRPFSLFSFIEGGGVLRTTLTSLKLSHCEVTRRFTQSEGIYGLSELVHLRDCQLTNIADAAHGIAIFPGSILEDLSQLTCLKLTLVGAEDMHELSRLTNLSVLELVVPHDIPDCEQLRFAPDIAPTGGNFALPASLQSLKLSDSLVLNPSVLSPCVHLTHLVLESLSGVVVGDGGQTSGGVLLSAIATMRQLVTLRLICLRLGPRLGGGAWPPLGPVYQALTASSQLQTLDVSYCNLPAAAWGHVFPAGSSTRVLPSLTELCSLGHDDMAWGPEVLSRVVRYCPALRDLTAHVENRFLWGFGRLSATLTHLQLSVACGEGQLEVGPAVGAVAALASLRDLDLRFSGPEAHISHHKSGLLPLTALRALTSCSIRGAAHFANKQTDPSKPPDVWKQLQEYCRPRRQQPRRRCRGPQ